MYFRFRCYRDPDCRRFDPQSDKFWFCCKFELLRFGRGSDPRLWVWSVTAIEFKGSDLARDIVLWGGALGLGVSVELPPHRGNDAGTGRRGRPPNLASLDNQYVPLLDGAFLARKRPVGDSWRMDKTDLSIKGQWNICVVPLIEPALRFPRKAAGQHGIPRTVTIDKSGAQHHGDRELQHRT